ncbi:MAG: helix-turn-helix transcriptional regulator [Rhodobacteraceae bacterium]|nr:helix-turn-helix transcriptional regulator [Paracoccaceae bacterium]
MRSQLSKVAPMPDTLRHSDELAADDHAAIAALIHRETTSFRNLDFDGWAACYVHAPRTCSVSVTPGMGVTVLRGWEAIRDDMLEAMAPGRTPCGMTDFRQENMQIMINCDIAWVVYDGWMRSDTGSEVNSIETTVAERTSEGWRIVYASFAHLRETQGAPDRIAVDGSGHLLWSGPAAADALRSHPALTISHGRLRARRRDWDKVLQATLARAGALHGFFQHRDFFDETGAPFRTPVVMGEDENGAAMVCSLLVMDGVTYVDIDPTTDLKRRLAASQAIFALSPGQMALAARIASGESLTDAAVSLGISINTARTHLKRIYEKTGVSSQTALVRLLLSVG